MLTARIRKNAANAAIDKIVREALAAAGKVGRTRTSFELLLRRARRSGLIDHASSGGRSAASGHREIIAGLLTLASHHKAWIRPVEEWLPIGTSPLTRFSSLAGHLLASYPVPHFMTSLWFEGRSVEARRRQDWYFHIGSGRNIRTADLPLLYTKKMAHELLQAPDHFTVEAALRWGQVRGLGGARELALAIATTRLGRARLSLEGFPSAMRSAVSSSSRLVPIGPSHASMKDKPETKNEATPAPFGIDSRPRSMFEMVSAIQARIRLASRSISAWSVLRN